MTVLTQFQMYETFILFVKIQKRSISLFVPQPDHITPGLDHKPLQFNLVYIDQEQKNTVLTQFQMYETFILFVKTQKKVIG